MISWDVNNGIARRSWARNKGAKFAISRAMERDSNLEITVSNLVNESILDNME
jgi:urocanate hydratase